MVFFYQMDQEIHLLQAKNYWYFKKLIEKQIPIFGICLGHQILSIALGAKTKKMFQGHRGSNHPVKNLINNFVEITSQNHGFEVDRETFSKILLKLIFHYLMELMKD